MTPWYSDIFCLLVSKVLAILNQIRGLLFQTSSSRCWDSTWELIVSTDNTLESQEKWLQRMLLVAAVAKSCCCPDFGQLKLLHATYKSVANLLDVLLEGANSHEGSFATVFDAFMEKYT